VNPLAHYLHRSRHGVGEAISPLDGKSIESLSYQLAKILDGTKPSEDFGLWLIEDCMHRAVELSLSQVPAIARRGTSNPSGFKRLRRKSKK